MKYSKQREAIKTFLRDRKDHPTADTVYMGVKSVCPNISLGTVYRNLTLLAENGEILKLNVGDGTDRFDPDTSPHHHFLCQQCGRVTDLSLPGIPPLEKMVEHESGNTVKASVIYFYGTCKKCMSMCEG